MAKKFLSIILAVNLLLFLFFIIFAGAVFGAGASGDWGSDSGGAQNTGDLELTYPWSDITGEGANSFSDLISRFYNIALAAVGVAALGAIVYGGILYTVSAGNSSKQTEARSWIGGAIAGLALLLGASLILRTIGEGVSETGQLTEPGLPALPEISAPTEYPPEIPITGPIDPNKPKEATIRSAGVQIRSSGGCTENKSNCTYVEGLPESTIDKVKQIFSACSATDCKNLAITGAAEPGHIEHGVGKPVIDLAGRQNSMEDALKIRDYLNSNKDKFGIVKIIDNVHHGSGPHVHVVFKS